MEDTSYRIRLSGGRRVVLPLSACEELDVDIGDTILLNIHDGNVRLQSFNKMMDQYRQHLRESVKPDRSLVDELIAERRAEAARE